MTSPRPSHTDKVVGGKVKPKHMSFGDNEIPVQQACNNTDLPKQEDPASGQSTPTPALLFHNREISVSDILPSSSWKQEKQSEMPLTLSMIEDEGNEEDLAAGIMSGGEFHSETDHMGGVDE